MASRGICDRVAIVGMGCTPFGEHWDKSADDLAVDAYAECVGSVPAIGKDGIDAYWFGTFASGLSGYALSRALKLDRKPVTRVENFCATGSEAFRNACYAVASGAYDCVAAIGVEKVKDTGYSGLVVRGPRHDATLPELTPPASFSLLLPSYAAKYGVERDQLRDAITHIAWKNHSNGALNPRAQFRSTVAKEKIAGAPTIAGDLGVFDCSGVADGAAAALIVRAEDAHKFTDKPIYVKALAFAVSSGAGPLTSDYDYATLPEVAVSAHDAYRQAGIDDPRTQISMAEVHDCFTPTEMILMEELGFSERGQAWSDVLAGVFDRDGSMPVNPDGGLKAFGHPIGASGLRMLFEVWQQFRGEAGERQLDMRGYGLTQNLGGVPGECVSFVSVLGDTLNA